MKIDCQNGDIESVVRCQTITIYNHNDDNDYYRLFYSRL